MSVALVQSPADIRPATGSGRRSDGPKDVPLGLEGFESLLSANEGWPLTSVAWSARTRAADFSPRGLNFAAQAEDSGLSHRSRLAALEADDASRRLHGRSRIGGASMPTADAPGARGARLAEERSLQADRASSGPKRNGSSSQAPPSIDPTKSLGPNVATVGARARTDPARAADPSRGLQSARTPVGGPPTAAEHGRLQQGATAPQAADGSRITAPGGIVAADPDRSRAGNAAQSPPPACPAIKGGNGGGADLRPPTEGERGGPTVRPVAGSAAKVDAVPVGQDALERDPGATGRSDSRKPAQQETADSARKATFDRIVKTLRSSVGRNGSVARIRLDPPSLGQVRVEVRMNGDALHVRLAAETDEGRRLLMSQVHELRSALERQGVRVHSMEFPATSNDGTRGGHLTTDDEGRPFDGQGQADSTHGDGTGRSANVYRGDESRQRMNTAGAAEVPDGWEDADTGFVTEGRLDVSV